MYGGALVFAHMVVRVSRAVLAKILTAMRVELREPEVEELRQELLVYFGLIGASGECEALEAAWNDPYNRRHIEEFIKAWLRRKRRKKAEPIPGVV
jgi:hypothetical protein